MVISCKFRVSSVCHSCVLRLECAELKIPLERGASLLQDVRSEGRLEITRFCFPAKVIEYKYIVAQEDSWFAISGASRMAVVAFIAAVASSVFEIELRDAEDNCQLLGSIERVA